MEWREKLQTVAATATVTSVAWLLIGSYVMLKPAAPGPVAQSPAASTALLAQQAPSSPMALTSVSAVQQVPTVTPLATGVLVIPVQGVKPSQLVDTFTQAREGGLRRHDAIDIMAPLGTPVIAAAAGTLEKLFVSVKGGNTIYVRSPDRRLSYYYAHLDHYAPGLKDGQQVSAGQLLGAVGYTGDASADGPHLHFAINLMEPAESWWKGTAINPYPLLMRR